MKTHSKKRVTFADSNTFDYEKSIMVNESSLHEATAFFRETDPAAEKFCDNTKQLLDSILEEDDTTSASQEALPEELVAFHVQGNRQLVYCLPLIN